jgi:hypothetical protein
MSMPMQPEAVQNRNSAFSEGHQMGGSPATSPGLQRQQQQENAAQPRGIKPALSSNGIAASQYSQTMGIFAPQNGISSDQYATAKYSMPRPS